MSQEAIFRQVQENFLLPKNFFEVEEIESSIDSALESLEWTSPVDVPVTKTLTTTKAAKFNKPVFHHYVGSVAYRIKQMLTDLSYSTNSQEEFTVLMNSTDLDLTRMFITREYCKNPKEFCDNMEEMGMLVANCNATATLIIHVAGRSLVLRYKKPAYVNVARPQRNP